MHDYDFNEPTTLLERSTSSSLQFLDFKSTLTPSSSLTRVGEDLPDLKPVYSPVISELKHQRLSQSSTINHQTKILNMNTSLSSRESALPLFDCNDKENTSNNRIPETHGFQQSTNSLKSNSLSGNLKKKRKAPISKKSLHSDHYNKSRAKLISFSLPNGESQLASFTSSGRISIKKARK